MNAYKICNPLFLTGKSVVEVASKEHDLDKIKPSALSKTRMENIIKRRKLNEDTVIDWKIDHGNYSCFS